MPLQYRPITGQWTLPDGGNPVRAAVTLTLVSPDWTPEALVVPDVVRLVVDADGDVVPHSGYTGQTVEVGGKDRAVVWASEDGEQQVLYRVAIQGELSRFDVAEVLIPSGVNPLTLQEIIELGVAPGTPRYITLLSFIAELFRGDWDVTETYLRGQQVRRGAAVYIASEDIGAGVDPLQGSPWDVYLIDAGIPAGGDTDAVLAKLSPQSSDAGWVTLTLGYLSDVTGTPTTAQVLRWSGSAWEPVTLGTAADQPTSAFDAFGAAAAVQGNLESHTEATTNVHGIANTANLVVTTDARLTDQRTPSDESVTDAKIVSGGLTPTSVTGTAVVDADARLTNQRMPTDGSVTDAKVAAGANIAPSKVAGTAVVNNDARLTNQRTPTDGSVTDAKIVSGGLAPSSIAGTAVVTADARLSDARTPTDGSVTDNKIVAGGLSPSKITGTAVITTDGRLSDARTPVTHGNEAHSATYVDASGASAAAPVQSVNTQTGAVVLDAASVGADPSGAAAGVQGNLDGHTGASTNVHGIANTADLVVTTDARLSDTRTPADGSVTDAKIVGGGLSPTAITGTAVVTNDSRLTDSRTPVTHGNEAHSATYVDAAGAASAAPVQSVQGLTGTVSFGATIADEGTYFALAPGA